MVSVEPCDKREAAARIAVAHPEQLARDPWATHLRECPECRDVCRDMAQSLAVFRQVEKDRLAGRSEFGPDWERFTAALQGEPRYRRLIQRFRFPAAAAAVGGMILFTGASLWLADLDNTPDSPARIVRFEPDQQQQMRQVVGQSLGSGPVVTMGRPAPRLSPIDPIASEEVATEPNRLYASGEVTLAAQPGLRRNHPFLDSSEVAEAGDDDTPRAAAGAPVFPVIPRPRMPEPATMPVFSPSGR
jgi:hypothetical protein